MDTNLKKVERRTIQYWYEDGIWEMTFGVMVLFPGIYLLGYALIPMKSLWRALWAIGMLPVIIIGIRFVRRTVRLLKEKWTYPRAGFVSYRRPDGRKRPRRFSLVGGMAGIVGALGYSLLRYSVGFSWVLAGFGLIFALTLFYIAIRTNLIRFFLLSVFVFAMGIVLARSGLAAVSGLSAFYCLMGLALCVSGAITLRQFVRKNPVLEKEQS
jgi:MFS family permease